MLRLNINQKDTCIKRCTVLLNRKERIIQKWWYKCALSREGAFFHLLLPCPPPAPPFPPWVAAAMRSTEVYICLDKIPIIFKVT